MTKHVSAHLRFLRVAPRKVRLVLGLIRGKNMEVAEQQLLALPKVSSQPILKLLKSAQANAQHNFKMDPKNLFVKEAYANEGPKLKRYQPHAMGRATVILKRMSHVTVVLAPLEEMPNKKKSVAPKVSSKKPAKTSTTTKPKAVKKEAPAATNTETK